MAWRVVNPPPFILKKVIQTMEPMKPIKSPLRKIPILRAIMSCKEPPNELGKGTKRHRIAENIDFVNHGEKRKTAREGCRLADI